MSPPPEQQHDENSPPGVHEHHKTPQHEPTASTHRNRGKKADDARGRADKDPDWRSAKPHLTPVNQQHEDTSYSGDTSSSYFACLAYSDDVDPELRRPIDEFANSPPYQEQYDDQDDDQQGAIAKHKKDDGCESADGYAMTIRLDSFYKKPYTSPPGKARHHNRHARRRKGRQRNRFDDHPQDVQGHPFYPHQPQDVKRCMVGH
ncbi:MAG: hypothetical protein VXX04_08685, partial [Actinomycetota bacterium]|nr:hypothetical protein [Actinomycetota bacterium]